MARAGESGRAGVRRSTAPSRGTGGARAAADAVRAQLRSRLEPSLATAGFDLEDLSVTRAGARSVVRVVVDRDGGIDLDAVADASRLVSAVLDGEDGGSGGTGGAAGSGASPISGPYVLEVTSPGVDRPLVEPRHWLRAVGRLVEVRRADGVEVTGRVLSADDEGADLAVPTAPARRGRPVRRRVERVVYSAVARAAVQVEFGSAADGDTGDTDTDTDTDTGAGVDLDLDSESDFDLDDELDDDDEPQDGEEPADEDGPEDEDGATDGGAPAASAAGEVEEDHGAVDTEAGLIGRTGKEMNR
ncbi:ribosome maturation factor RimP [Parafrankia discariae]|uniref:ribosome maturation factor RimP n=1 Tax=Parafrankia discariae TaxID=365528 RepID=UPI000476404A|nr:ribosome maturation factor RimP [Parafrankia discariae]